MRRKTRAVALWAIVFAMVSGVVVGAFAAMERKNQSPVMESASNIAIAQPQAKKPRYLLGEHEGKLAVFIIGKKEPELIFDRYLHYLPDVDREKLEKGIEVAEYSELMRLIEDYTS